MKFSFFISLLSVSISFDIILFNGKSSRHPNTNQFIDDICQQLHQAIEIYEKTTLSKMRIFSSYYYFYLQ
jgi:hypothetical protein